MTIATCNKCALAAGTVFFAANIVLPVNTSVVHDSSFAKLHRNCVSKLKLKEQQLEIEGE